MKYSRLIFKVFIIFSLVYGFIRACERDNGKEKNNKIKERLAVLNHKLP